MRERADWIKSQSHIEKRTSLVSQKSHHPFAVSTPAATDQMATLEDRGFRIANTCLFGEARGDRFWTLLRRKSGIGEEPVRLLTLCPNSDAAMIVAFADRAG
jgi:hypothetical protein